MKQSKNENKEEDGIDVEEEHYDIGLWYLSNLIPELWRTSWETCRYEQQPFNPKRL